MKKNHYIKIVIFLLGAGVVFLNLKASRRLQTGYFFLENPSYSRWIEVLDLLSKDEREKFFKCCVSKKVKEKIEGFEQKRKERIVTLEKALKVNPYAWKAMLELAALYEKEGRKERAKVLREKAEKLAPEALVKSYLRNL